VHHKKHAPKAYLLYVMAMDAMKFRGYFGVQTPRLLRHAFKFNARFLK